jgi:hypothetical protein
MRGGGGGLCVLFLQGMRQGQFVENFTQLVVHLCTRMVPTEGVGEDSNTHHPMDMST